MEQNARGESRPTLKDLMDAYERTLIGDALAATRGNQRQAALRLGVLATTLHEKMKRLGMAARTGTSPRQEPSARRPDSAETAVF
jgi:DNA-binding NtrC family response regulator